MKRFILVGLTLLFTGCAAQRQVVKVTCFSNGEASDKPSISRDAVPPIMMVKGCTVFYDTDNNMHEVCNANCGVR